MTNAMHTSDTSEHFTPRHVVEAARTTLGTIDLDPASCAKANEVVRARRYFTAEDNALRQSWSHVDDDGGLHPARVFCNPPGGKRNGQSVQKLFWRHAVHEYAMHRVDAMIWIAFKVDFLQTTQVGASSADLLPLDGAICYPRTRLEYLSPTLPTPTKKQPNRKPTKKQLDDFERTGLCTGDSPPHASAIIYLPSRRDPGGLARFVSAFSEIGAVRFDSRYLTAA